MKLVPLKIVAVAALSFWLVGCANATGEDVGTVAGAGVGALAGYAIAPNNAVGTVIGAGAGALVGREVGRRHDVRVERREVRREVHRDRSGPAYRHRYYRSGY